MRKRFAIVIGVAAAGVMALGAQTAAAAAVVKYDTELTISRDRGHFFHGNVNSGVWKCEAGRRVALFKQRPGPDRKLGIDRAGRSGSSEVVWGMVDRRTKSGWRLYARVRRIEAAGHRNRIVCRSDRTPLCQGGCGGVARASAAALASQPGKIDSRVTLVVGCAHHVPGGCDADLIHGLVKSSKHACEVQRTVKYFERRSHGPDTLRGEDETNNHGRWRLAPREPNPGFYYAKVLRREVDTAGTTFVCRRDRTAILDYH